MIRFLKWCFEISFSDDSQYDINKRELRSKSKQVQPRRSTRSKNGKKTTSFVQSCRNCSKIFQRRYFLDKHEAICWAKRRNHTWPTVEKLFEENQEHNLTLRSKINRKIKRVNIKRSYSKRLLQNTSPLTITTRNRSCQVLIASRHNSEGNGYASTSPSPVPVKFVSLNEVRTKPRKRTLRRRRNVGGNRKRTRERSVKQEVISNDSKIISNKQSKSSDIADTNDSSAVEDNVENKQHIMNGSYDMLFDDESIF